MKSILKGHGLFSLNEITLICSLNVPTQFWAWIKIATNNFSTVLTRNLRNPRDYAPLKVSISDSGSERVKVLCILFRPHQKCRASMFISTPPPPPPQESLFRQFMPLQMKNNLGC